MAGNDLFCSVSRIAAMAQNDRKDCSPYIEGYLSELFNCGKQPSYGYPVNHLPEVSDTCLQFTVGFLASADTR